MGWLILRPQIKQVLDTITSLKEVTSYPKIKFSGYPAAYVVPNSNDASYETTTENIRTYAFTIRVFYETKVKGIEDSLTVLDGVVDSIIDKFDEEDQSSTRILGQNLPANYTFLNIWAAPASWGEVPGEQLIMAEIVVRIRVSVDVV